MAYINLHTHHSSNEEDVLDIVNIYPDESEASAKFYSTGIHPWHINPENLEKELNIIENRMGQANCLALGECGLDKRIETPLSLQLEVFEKQLLMAEKYQKPVIVHCVAAFGEAIEIRKRLKISVPTIIHGFSKNIEIAKQLLDHGFYLSFGKYLLRNPELESVFTSVPDNKFFLETDTIEEGIREVYSLAAKYRKISESELKDIVNTNFKTVFKPQK